LEKEGHTGLDLWIWGAVGNIHAVYDQKFLHM